jgi:hypothetical protein
MLERALSIARTQRIQATRRGGMVRSPPMAYVEEVIPEEPIQIPLESLLFTVPENWQPPSNFFVEDTKPATAAHHDTNTMEEKIEEVHICIVEEEFSRRNSSTWPLRMPYFQKATIFQCHSEGRGPREGGRSTGMERNEEHKDGAQDGVQAATGEAVEGLGGTMMEGGEVFAPPPISIVPEPWRAPPPFFHPEQLELVFDLRSQMADQVHRGTLMHQRIDMLYEAFSNAPAGQKCPTCARLLPCRLGTDRTTKTLAKLLLMLTGNCMAWSSSGSG